MNRKNLSISAEYKTLPGLTRIFRDKQEIRGHFCPRIFSNSFYLLVSFPARNIRRRQNLHKSQLSSVSVKKWAWPLPHASQEYIEEEYKGTSMWHLTTKYGLFLLFTNQ